MSFDYIIIRYGEIGLKATYTRKIFEQTLIKNIKKAFDKKNITCSIQREFGRIYIVTKQVEKALIILKHIFGIVSFSPAIITQSTQENIAKTTLAYSKDKITQNDHIALRVKRTGNHSFSSQDIARYVGNELCSTYQCSVDLSNPSVEIFIEIRNQNTYIFSQIYQGPGGLPYATQGMICAVIKHEDDILAAWSLMCRGCAVVFFSDKKQLITSIKAMTDTWYINAPIHQKDDKNQQSPLNEIIKKYNCQAICIGSPLDSSEALLEQMQRIKIEYGISVLTPLICYNKHEINQMKKNVGITQ